MGSQSCVENGEIILGIDVYSPTPPLKAASAVTRALRSHDLVWFTIRPRVI